MSRSVHPPAGRSSSSPPPVVPFSVSPWGRYRDVAAYSGFSIAHIEKAAYSGQLKSHGHGKGRRFHRDDIDDWMRRGAKATAAEIERAVVA